MQQMMVTIIAKRKMQTREMTRGTTHWPSKYSQLLLSGSSQAIMKPVVFEKVEGLYTLVW